MSNKVVYCDGGLPVCDAKGVTYPDTACETCAGVCRDELQSLGAPSIRLGDYVTPQEIAAATRATEHLTWRECELYEYEGLPLGRFVQVSMCAYFRVGSLSGSPGSLDVFRRFVATATVLVQFHSRMIASLRPERLIVLNGLYAGWRIAYEIGKSLGVPVTTWDLGQRPNTLICAHNEISIYFDHLPPLWRSLGTTLGEAQRKQITHYLANRVSGDQGVITFNEQALVDDAQLRQALGVPKQSDLYAVYTNVEWDSAAIGRDTAFRNQWDWLETTLQYFAERPEIHIVVRVHPGEARIPMIRAREFIASRIREAWPSLPANIHVVDWSDEISSYSILRSAKAVLVYTSTIGLEAACSSIPVIVAGRTHYARNGFTVDPADRGQYLRALDALGAGLGAKPDHELALSYAHFYFIRSLIPFRSIIRMDTLFQWTALEPRGTLPGGDPYIDLLCNILLGVSPPFLPDDMLEGALADA